MKIYYYNFICFVCLFVCLFVFVVFLLLLLFDFLPPVGVMILCSVTKFEVYVFSSMYFRDLYFQLRL